jgi:uncharacterized membrane protein
MGFGLAFVLFVPGYALIAALFPEAGSGPAAEEADDDEGERADDTATATATPATGDGGIDGIERVALSFGLSIAVVPLIGLVLNFTPWGIRLVPILVGVGGFTVVASVVAAYRRLELPADERFRVPFREWYLAGRGELVEPESRTDAALNVLLVLSVILAASSVAFAVAVPKQGEQFTEFYVLTENETGGLVADGYPTEFQVGASKPVVVGIGNQEHRRTNYTAVVVVQNVSFELGDEPANATANATVVEVPESIELGRFSAALAHNETWHRTYELRPTMTGTNLRLAFLLYRGTPPESPTVDNAYRELHLWVNVTGE